MQDPHNLGSCLRTALALGADAVIMPKNASCPINSTVRKVASGAADIIPSYYVNNLASAMVELQKKVVGFMRFQNTLIRI